MVRLLPVAQTTFKGIGLASICLLWVIASPVFSVSDSSEIAIVIKDGLKLRAEPAGDKRVLAVLTKDTRVNIRKRLGDWLEVTHNKQAGYLLNKPGHVRIVYSQKISEDHHAPNDIRKPLERIEDYKHEAQGIIRTLKEREAEVKKFSKQEIKVVRGLNKLDRKLNATAIRVTDLRKELDRLDEKIQLATTRSIKLRQKIKDNEAYAAKRLVALYKLNWLGRYHVFASAQSIDQLFERKAALERILESDHHFWRRLIEDKQQLSDILLALNRQKEDKLAVDAKFRAQIQKLSRERAKRNKLLKAIRSQKSLGLAAIEVLKEASKELDRKIESLNQEIRSIRKAVKNAFAAFKGLLKIPVKGKIISSFGYYKDPELNVENFRSGIDIQAERGDPIRSVSDGQTLYSDWFKGFGNMIIIDHGDNYYTVYAHADELFKAKGDPVEMGEVIGTVGDTGSITGAKLYFEIRHRGKAQDPLAWLKKG